MRRMSAIYLLVCVVLLVGCASVPMTSESLDAEGKKFIPEPGTASIYVYRGTGPIGTAVLFETILDGRVVGSLAPGTYQLLTVSPGQHTLVVHAQENVQQQKVLAEAGRTYFFRASTDIGLVSARVYLQPVDEQEGRRGVIGTRRSEATAYEEKEDLKSAIEASIQSASARISVNIPKMLRLGDYNGADQQLRGLQARYEADHRNERDLVVALWVVNDMSDNDLEELYAEWVRRMPNSFAPYLAAGVYHVSRGYQARGGARYAKTGPDKIRAMIVELHKAEQLLEQARKLHPQVVISYAWSIEVAKPDCDKREIERLRDTALEIAPDSWYVRALYLSAIAPRWCGSIAEMQKFLDESLPYITSNPNLSFLKGRVIFEQGEELTVMAEKPRYEEALPYYTEALSCGDYPYYRSGRARTLLALGRYDEAVADLEVAIQGQPANREWHEELVRARSKRPK